MASVKLSHRTAGISTRSGVWRDIGKFGALQKSLRTAAMALLKEGSLCRATRPISEKGSSRFLDLAPTGSRARIAEQRRRCSRDGEIGPLTLRFDAQMRAASLEGHFD